MRLLPPKAARAVRLLASQPVRSRPRSELVGAWGGEELPAANPKWFKYKAKKIDFVSYDEIFRGFMDSGVAGFEAQ